MIDLTPLNGLLAGAVLTLVAQRLRNRVPAPAPEPTPSPNPTPSPVEPGPFSPTGRPILDALLKALLLRLGKPQAFGANGTEELEDKLIRLLGEAK